MTKLHDTVIDDLKADEGLVLHEYKDHLGYSTIGYGRLIDERRGGGISEDEAEYLLSNDVNRVYQELSSKIAWFDRAPGDVKRALINMAFQMGVSGLLGFKNTLRLIEQQRYNEAADNALISRWAKQTPKRAKQVTDWMRI